ncbi:MAG: hypothetical protein AB7G23_16140 [Vicinamibacterales bacterium]
MMRRRVAVNLCVTWLALTAAPGVPSPTLHGQTGAGQAGAAQAGAAQAPVNKARIVEFFGFRGSREERAALFMTEDYVQHNPRFLRMDEFTGARGRDAWVQSFQEAARRGGIALVALGGIALRNPVILLADGDIVHAVYRGVRPDPEQAGRTYAAFAFESFRVRDGRFAEHWDQVALDAGWMTPPPSRAAGTAPAAPGTAGGVSLAPAPAAGGTSAAPAAPTAVPALVAAPAPIAPPVPQPPAGCAVPGAQLVEHRRLALAFLEGAPTRDGVRTRASVLAPGFVEHSPQLVRFNEQRGLSGRNGFLAAVGEGLLDGTPRDRAIDHVVAECDYVSIVWKQVRPDPDRPGRTWEHFTFDTVRIAGGQVAERWDSSSL